VASILVVEDEDEIRAMLVELLEEAGFEVVEAGTGDLASVVLQSMRGLDALVTDVHMPGELDGVALASLFRQRYPERPILYVTGNPSALRDVPMCRGKDAILSKPYRLAALIRALRSLLAADSGAGDAARAEAKLVAV